MVLTESVGSVPLTLLFYVPQYLLSENNRVRGLIPSAIEVLCGPHVQKVEDALEAGLTTLSWTSINVVPYVEKAHKALGKLVCAGKSRLVTLDWLDPFSINLNRLIGI